MNTLIMKAYSLAYSDETACNSAKPKEIEFTVHKMFAFIKKRLSNYQNCQLIPFQSTKQIISALIRAYELPSRAIYFI